MSKNEYLCSIETVIYMDNYRLYSIGHSNQSQDEFLTKLQAYGVDCVVDVRSVPASKYSPQFNGDALKWFLRWKGVQYLHFGEEFGARRMDCINDEGPVDCRVGGLARSDVIRFII